MSLAAAEETLPAQELLPAEDEPGAVAFHAQQLSPASSYGRLAYQKNSAVVVYIHPDKLLDSQGDIAEVQVSEEGAGLFGVSFQLTPSGLDDVVALAEGSAAGSNHPIHLLVRGEVTHEYTARDFLAGRVTMATGLSREVAAEYQAALTK